MSNRIATDTLIHDGAGIMRFRAAFRGDKRGR
jgi:hypothetical protein